MIKTTTKAILLFTMLFLFCTCKRKDENKGPYPGADCSSGKCYFGVPEELKAYYFFKKGSYWIYENDKTGELDTQTVISDNVFWQDGNNNEMWQMAEVKIKSSYDGFTYDYQCFTQGSAKCNKDGRNTRQPCYTLNCTRYKPGNVSGETNCLFYDFHIGYSWFADYTSDESQLKLIEKIDSFKMNNTYFKETLHFYMNYSYLNNRKDINFYWSKNKGIVKKEIINDSQSWNLIVSELYQ